MAIVSKADLLKKINEIVGDNTSDAVLGLLDDVSDTFDDAEKRANGDGENWKEKYEQNDAEWRKKYRDRFMQGADAPDEQLPNGGKQNTDGGDEKPELKSSFDQLFSE